MRQENLTIEEVMYELHLLVITLCAEDELWIGRERKPIGYSDYLKMRDEVRRYMARKGAGFTEFAAIVEDTSD